MKYRQNQEFLRAKNMVIADKFDFQKDTFCKELTAFLSDYFRFDGLTVEIQEGERHNMLLYVSVENVKKTRAI